MRLLLDLITLIRALASDRARLALENAALRQQLNVLRRNAKRPRIHDSDRLFWVLISRLFDEWKEHLILVKPETVVRWHRQGFRYYWRWKSRSKPGRPPIPMEVIHLIRRMSTENVLWGAPRIRSELALLGHDVAESTIANYMVKPKRSESRMIQAAVCAYHPHAHRMPPSTVEPAASPDHATTLSLTATLRLGVGLSFRKGRPFLYSSATVQPRPPLRSIELTQWLE